MPSILLKAIGVSTILALSLSANAQIDTIGLDKGHQLKTAYLKPGMKQYLVYAQQAQQKKALRFSIWTRDIKRDKRNGEDVFDISQHWFGSDTLGYRTVHSINRAADFAPIFHAENIAGKLKAFNWGAKSIVGADTVANNQQKAFKLDLAIPTLNWNLDIETFEALPLAAGKSFAINFYDAGTSAPQYALYKVAGSEVIELLDNTKADCWKLVYENKMPNGQPYTQTFWISKKNHEFLKEEDAVAGTYRYKIKMPAMVPDILKRF